MLKKLSKVPIYVLILSFIVSFQPALPSQAASFTGDITSTITYRYANETLFIEGSGEIPDYTLTSSRPWASLDIKKLSVGSDITRIGSYAFYGFKNLEYIEIPSTTFVADKTSFGVCDGNSIIRVTGTGVKYENLGASIVYSSLNSIYAASPNGRYSRYIFDTSDMAANFRCSVYPYCMYCYDISQSGDDPWRWYVKYFDESSMKNLIHDPVTTYGSKMQGVKEPMSETYLEGFATFIDAYNLTYIQSYYSYYSCRKTDEAQNYVLDLEKGYDGYTLYLFQQLSDGSFYLLEDKDTIASTFTFRTQYPMGSLILVALNK